jgi:hypothetical protein
MYEKQVIHLFKHMQRVLVFIVVNICVVVYIQLFVSIYVLVPDHGGGRRK